MISFITGIGSVMILWLGGQQIIGGVLTIGELVAFNSYWVSSGRDANLAAFGATAKVAGFRGPCLQANRP